MKHLIESFCAAYHLGCMIGDPKPVSGGLMHTMYRIQTTQGEYAVKLLNADIMKRPTAYQNMVNSEIVSNALKDTVPVVAAKDFDGEHIIKYGGEYWMVFDWVEGKSIYPPELSVQHCQLTGDLLGRIHAANLRIPSISRSAEPYLPIAWQELLETARLNCTDCYALLLEHMDAIQTWDHQLAASWPLVQSCQVISHRDLDPKNVMWHNDRPVIIDWEAAGYVNPAQELIEVLNYWIVDADGQYSHAKFQALMDGYSAHMPLRNVEWDAVLSASFSGMIGWLAYNVRRAVGLEGSSDTDRSEGLAQVRQTIHELHLYQNQMILLKSRINE